MGAKRFEDLKGNIDPILTGLAQGYTNQAFVADELCPDVFVPELTGKYPVFGKEHLTMNKDDRPLKAPVKQMSVKGWEFKSFEVKEHALEFPIDHLEIEAAKKVADLEEYGAKAVMESMLLNKEYEKASMLQDAANYETDHKVSLTTDTYFDDPDSDPITVIKDAMLTIRSKGLPDPNKIVYAPDSFRAFSEHPKILEKIKYSAKAVITPDMVPGLLGITDRNFKVVIGSGLYYDSVNETFVKLWSDTVVIGHVKSGAGLYDMSLAKTFVQRGFPKMIRHQTGDTITRFITGFMRYNSYMTQNLAGYLINNTIGG